MDYLLEIGVEEIPARFIPGIIEEVKNKGEEFLKEFGVQYEAVISEATPRRIVFYVKGVLPKTEEKIQEVKGPAKKASYDSEGNPTRALLGFARSQGIEPNEVIEKEVNGVIYVFARKKTGGNPVDELLPEIARKLIKSLSFPKPMRWGDIDFKFIRPIRWLVSLLDEKVIPLEIAGIKADRISRGHRFLGQKEVVLDRAADYFVAMRENYVIVSLNERIEMIRAQLHRASAEEGVVVDQDEELLLENANLVEYPTVVIGEINREFLELPKEVIITPMKEHQRYFPLFKNDGSLYHKFLAVRNGGRENLAEIAEGYAKVLRARLYDARFFYREDLKKPLSAYNEKLTRIVFQEKLGTVWDKVLRLKELVVAIGRELNCDDEVKSYAARAAELSKADLATNMVYEFPELQGIMGRDYALKSGERKEVADAIFEHYLPRFSGDIVATSEVGILLSCAEKIDNLTAFFALKQIPTGSADPFGLRRQALGLLRTLIENKRFFSLKKAFDAAFNLLPAEVREKANFAEVYEELLEFIYQRFKGLLLEEGFSYDTIDAVLATGKDDFYDLYLRVRALENLRNHPSFTALTTTFTRAYNLARKGQGREVAESLLYEPAEKELFARFSEISLNVKEFLREKAYLKAMEEVAALANPLDRFFNEVLVMAEDEKIRENRLGLLGAIARLVLEIADLSKIVG
ncbi:glycine--tRNA ligase subunit beta [Carboxydothermus ferrireducens]|uniref:Glycine--tRNA ligase beta subunit n=1 Tax=Carboxydothermus ferrireducens DSM 11255 TaxID=1119529 RepID=A0ABX2R971_9THEO|nr:glycine--tRNA ligase subunit beta [Carboxydothermus ferrireducens]NYE56333.1 glycyl-tRNA synthetase beta chain [Carboxydothermus ferrireducens DSM 11255]